MANPVSSRFQNRADAGKKLAELLKRYTNGNAVIYALPRGGVVTGYEIAKNLNLPLDLIITRKIGHPFSEEYAICAIAEDGDYICNEAEKRNVEDSWFKAKALDERAEARRRRETYLVSGAHISGKGKIAILVDDGAATGLTMKLAIKEAKHDAPARIVVAVPVLPKELALELKREIDELVAIGEDEDYLGAVGAYYDEFPQIEDKEVVKLMSESSDFGKNSQ